jgi:hydroxymethylbilane synthase
VTIGTRGSALARWQAAYIAEALRTAHDDVVIEERIIKTEGDASQEQAGAAAAPGQTGVFVRRIEESLIAGDVDLAVHSLKDMPTDQPDGLAILAVPERHDSRDALISREGWTLDEVPAGTRVGTGSPRRCCQLLHHRPDLDFVPIRGNVDTRLRKVHQGQVGAVVLALAGLERLGLDALPIRPLDAALCLPAVGQGALAVECRLEEPETARLVASLNHEASFIRVEAERAFLRRLGGGCLAPATAHATIINGRLHVEAVVGRPDGVSLLLERESGAVDDARIIGTRLAERLLVAGAERILEEVRAGESAGHDGF